MVENRDFKGASLLSKIDYYRDIIAEAKDINESGLCMRTQTSLSKGIPLILKFGLEEKGCVNTIGIIVRCQQINTESFECAVKYTSISIIDQQKIREYVYEQLRDESDRRHDFRTNINISIDYTAPTKSVVKNYNSKGLCIVTNQGFAPGSMILLTFTMPEYDKIHVYGKVVWCYTIKPGTFKIGIT
ncbi:MAG: PilZ domain-containing protein [Spirochaetales bacterium]|nr:PilZ domain-containing protein [Spirochaetales bacterium]